MYNKSEIMRELIKNFFNNVPVNNDKPNLYFFQGFTQDFYVELSKVMPHLTFEITDKYPSVLTFINESTNILVKVLQLKQDNWSYYEELCVLYQSMRCLPVTFNIIIVYNDIFDHYYPLSIDKSIYEHLLDEDLRQKDRDEFKLYSACKEEAWGSLVSFVNCHFKDDIGRDDVKSCGFYKTSITEKKIINSFEQTTISRNELISYIDKLQCGLLTNQHYRVIGLTKNHIKQLSIVNLLGSYYGVEFADDTIEERSDNADKYLPTLKKYWGEDAKFRKVKFYKNPGINNETEEISQGIIVGDIIEEAIKAQENKTYSDIIITAPTGAGKSLLFQIPGFYLSNKDEPLVTIVISPLVVLMADQVREIEDKGYYYATFINSDISYEERQMRLAGIKNGDYSLVYMSPELFLSYNITSLIGERTLGMIVIDEAHLVTSWGRDFRVDYWFLGGYLTKLRQGSSRSNTPCMNFPVICLTATAVNGGNEDVVGDLTESLSLIVDPAHIYIGYVKRDNIDFTVRNPGKVSNEDKLKIVNDAIAQFVKNNEKTIVYFPFTKQVEDFYRNLQILYRDIVSKVSKYHGSLDKNTRSKSYEDFRSGKSTVMLATKAFGMGVNISDVVNVYHYAPTGTLADYVQEIGRAARKLPNGHAIIDFSPNDMSHVRTLWGLSRLKNYQLQAMLKKLYGMYKVQKEQNKGDSARNLLFSAEEFNYLFDMDGIDNKVKSGLMLLNTDLKATYKFNVITVRPKDLLTTQYIMIPYSTENEFLAEFGQYCKKRNDVYARIRAPQGRNGTEKITRSGDIYEIYLDKLWKDRFHNLTFAGFKYKFFSGELFKIIKDEPIVANMRLAIHYPEANDETNCRFENVCKQVNEIAVALRATFNDISRGNGRKEFEFKDFKERFVKNYPNEVSDNNLRILLDMFVGERVEDNPLAPPQGEWKFVVKRTHSTNKIGYTLSASKASFIESNLNRYINDMKPNSNDNKTYVDYLPLPPIGSNKPNKRSSYQQLIASLLQLFDIASYEVEGGSNPQIFVRINDPLKIQALSSIKTYNNKILTNIRNKHENAIKILNSFMLNSYTNEERWDIIEKYFLGQDEVVNSLLNIKYTKNQ